MKLLLFLLAFGLGHAQSFTFLEFDAPGADHTEASGINNRGQIVGSYTSPSGPHCFLRDPAGAFTSFDPRGTNASCAGLNNLGQVVGTFSDSSGSHGYIRSPMGDFTTFDLTGA